MRHLVLALALTVSLVAVHAEEAFQLDVNHSRIGFAIEHLGINLVHGQFNEFAGTLTYDPATKQLTGADVTIPVASIDTGVARRDDHLRSDDFFGVEEHPQMTFKATKVEVVDGQAALVGELTIRGVTKPLRLPFALRGPIADKAGQRLGFSATTTINRRDFGIAYGNNLPDGTPAIANDVHIRVDAEATLAKE